MLHKMDFILGCVETFKTENNEVIIIDMSVAMGTVSLLVCSLVCVVAIRSGQVRRKLRAFILGRVLDF
jgi:hypothetical protein